MINTMTEVPRTKECPKSMFKAVASMPHSGLSFFIYNVFLTFDKQSAE